MKGIGLLIFCFISFSCLLAQNYNNRIIESSRHWLDLDYVGDGHIGHRLDIHLPTTVQEKYPAVICIYGSAWFSNNLKSAAYRRGIGQYLLSDGFAVITINHRSSRDTVFPAQIHDVKAAIRFVRGNGDIFSIDTNFIGITGWSSGGHLAAFAGTSSHTSEFAAQGQEIDLEGDLGDFTETSSHVDAVVDWFGPTDFLIMDDCGSSFSHNEAKSPESSLVGGEIQANQITCLFADPATYVNHTNPPFLIFHGDADPLVPHCQSEHLHEKLQAAGAKSELFIIEEGKHGPGVMIKAHFQKMIDFYNSIRP